LSNKESIDSNSFESRFSFENKEYVTDKAREVTFAPAFAKREDVSNSGDVFPLYFFI